MFLYLFFLAVCLLANASLSLGAHVFFEINLTWELRAPDGQPRYVILSNGQFPGPQLNMNYGDDVEVSHYSKYKYMELTLPSLSFTTTFPLIRLFIFMALSMLVSLYSREQRC